MSHLKASTFISSRPGGDVMAVAFGQILSWGGIYYAFAAMGGEMRREFDCSVFALNGAMSAGLAAAALASCPVGKLIQNGHGRRVMTGGSVLAGLLLVAWGCVDSLAGLYLVWSAIGITMAGVLYDAAFAVTVQLSGVNFRKGLALVTFLGGFASTLFFPMIQGGIEIFGWRSTAVLLGLVQLLTSAPLYGWGLRSLREIGRSRVSQTSPGARRFFLSRTLLRDKRFVGMGTWFISHNMAFSGLIFQVFPLMAFWQINPATAVAALALIGPMQVAGRVLMVWILPDLPPRRIGISLMGALGFSSLLLMLVPVRIEFLFAFAGLYGLGNGMMTLLRGTAVGILFGTDRYPEINGGLASLSMIAKALSPMALAAVWTVSGNAYVPLLAVTALACVGMVGVHFATAADGPECRTLTDVARGEI